MSHFYNFIYIYAIGNFRVNCPIYSEIKDLLQRCALPLSLCWGQAYDGAAVMKGIRRSGVATRIKKDTPQALPVHCFAHSLNLCLQDAGRNIKLLRDATSAGLDCTRKVHHVHRVHHNYTQ